MHIVCSPPHTSKKLWHRRGHSLDVARHGHHDTKTQNKLFYNTNFRVTSHLVGLSALTAFYGA